MPKNRIIKKSIHDKFYTKPEVAKRCLDELEKYTDKNDLYVEPSAGSGSFYNKIQNPKIGYDILPDCDVIEGDWFDQSPSFGCVVVGNPPFGERNKLTKAFIQHSMKFARCIAFILPKVFRKETSQRIFPENWCLLEDHDLPDNSFTLDGEDYHVPCVFQIWYNKDILDYGIDLRESKKKKLQTTHFTFGNVTECEHFMFGAAPHKIILKDAVMHTNRGYYFNANNLVIERIQSIPWKDYGLSSVTGGVSWFSKQQIIDVYSSNHIDTSE